jgi:hypothetical protein
LIRIFRISSEAYMTNPWISMITPITFVRNILKIRPSTAKSIFLLDSKRLAS